MTTRQPIVPDIPPFRGGPLQNRNATNNPQQSSHQSSSSSKHSGSPPKSHPHPQQQQQRQQRPKPTTRLEREKKKNYNDPLTIGPWNLGKLIGQGASGELREASVGSREKLLAETVGRGFEISTCFKD